MKRFNISFIAVLCCISSFAANGTKIGQFYYILNDATLTATVTWGGGQSSSGTPGYSGAISIPSTISDESKQYSVTSIGNSAFEGCSGLTSITIPEGVTSIGSSAFNGCSGLKSITIPSSVTSIKGNAFYGCSGLKSITIPSSVTSIGSYAFRGCSGLTSITIPSSVTSIETGAFERCFGLKSITIPSGVTSIGSNAFKNCFGLTSITIPSSVTSIETGAFNGCSGLTSITIPEGVTSIGTSAFADCSNLESLVVLPATPPSVGTNAFNNVSPDITVYVYDVDEYEKGTWGGFTNIKGLGDYKIKALNEIDAAMEDVELTDAEKVAISVYKGQVSSASDLAAAVAAKEAALAFINLHPTKAAALAEIQKEMKGATGSAYLNGLVAENVNAINAATDVNTINSNKESAINKIKAVIDIYKAGASETLGAMGEEKTNCPAVKVTKGDKVVILYAPEKVEMIKVSENK